MNDQGEVLPPGEPGEVVMTPLAIEGMPLLRFKTGDISFVIDEPCACGRHSPRLGPILGRKKQMIKFRGTTLYPNSLYTVLDSFPGISEYYVTATSDYDLSDVVRVTVAVKDPSCSADMIMDKLQAHLRVRPEVIIASEESVKSQVYTGNSRKLIRFVDKRKNNMKTCQSRIYGAEFSQQEIAEAVRDGRLLSMEMEFNKSCNFRCLYCYASDHTVHRNELSKHEFLDLINQARELGARKIIVLGGEPMLYPPIIEMIQYIRDLDMDVELFTNGTNITTRDGSDAV